MAKENIAEHVSDEEKTASNESLESREKSTHSGDEEDKDEEDEDSSKGKRKHNKRKESECEDFESKAERGRGESIAIPIEDDAADATDGKISQRQANTYAAKKTVAQGMMDIALITANANQLRFMIEFNRNSSTYYVNLFLIIISLCLQVGVGVSLIFKGRLDLRGQSKHRNAKRINNYVVVGVFLVTIINVFIASFTVTGGGANGGGHLQNNGVKVR